MKSSLDQRILQLRLGDRIKKRREMLGLSQNDLAIELRIPQGKICQIEKGIRRVELLIELPALAKALDRPLEWFVYVEEDR
jgi:transcriptional regulator with XRE-family HTH domain